MAEAPITPPADHGQLLVVDDERFLREAVAASLRFLGFEVSTALRADGFSQRHRSEYRTSAVAGLRPLPHCRRTGNRSPAAALGGRRRQAEA